MLSVVGVAACVLEDLAEYLLEICVCFIGLYVALEI